MIDLAKYRVIDLSFELVPGELRINGQYLHGNPLWGRPIELQEFIAYGARMHFIQGQTHSGTHVEAPYKYSESGADLGSLPISSYMGEAVVCNFSNKKPGEAISAEDLRQAGVKSGDIVLVWGAPDPHENFPYLVPEAVDWLIKTRIKLLGNQNVLLSPPGTPLGLGDADAKCLLAGITLVDNLLGLEQIKKPRVFFIALPVKLRRVTAFWTRAIALEEI